MHRNEYPSSDHRWMQFSIMHANEFHHFIQCADMTCGTVVQEISSIKEINSNFRYRRQSHLFRKSTVGSWNSFDLIYVSSKMKYLNFMFRPYHPINGLEYFAAADVSELFAFALNASALTWKRRHLLECRFVCAPLFTQMLVHRSKWIVFRVHVSGLLIEFRQTTAQPSRDQSMVEASQQYSHCGA